MPDLYATINDATAYFETRLNADAWDDASVVDRGKALAQATRAIDRLYFFGVKTSVYLNQVPEQPLEFPRNGSLVIPDGIKFACCELALAFLDGVDPDLEIGDAQILSQGFASVRQTRTNLPIPFYVLAGIPSATAWMYLQPYLADPRSIRLVRTT